MGWTGKGANRHILSLFIPVPQLEMRLRGARKKIATYVYLSGPALRKNEMYKSKMSFMPSPRIER